MAGFGFSIKFWCLNQTKVSDKEITASQYHDKEAGPGEYYDAKKLFVTSRNEVWTPRNKKALKLRENIKILEETLKSNEVVFLKWQEQKNAIKLAFSSGLLADIELTENGDTQKITLEKSMVGKVTDASSAIWTSSFACFAFEDQTKLAFYTLKSEIKPSQVDIPGPQKRLKRHLVVNSGEDMMICWWKQGSWLQSAPDNERINLVLLGCSFGRLEVLSSIQSEHEIVSLNFSRTNTNQIITLEKSYNVRNERHLDSVVYECSRNKVQRLHVVSFPMKHAVLCSDRNSDEDRLVVGCSNGSLFLLDLVTQATVATVTSPDLVPTTVAFLGGVILVGGSRGELTMYDGVLDQIAFFNLDEKEFMRLELSKYLSSENGLSQLVSDQHNSIAMLFSGGPLSLLRLIGKLNHEEVICRHLFNDKVNEAVDLLCSLNWNYSGPEAFHGLMTIADHLLTLPLNHHREKQLEATFSSFYSSPRAISEGIVLKYRHTISCYARRFFHHLVRYRHFEMAFLLAKDIRSSDLFLDIYFEAKDCGERQLARLAKQKADEILAADSSDDESINGVPTVPEVILQSPNISGAKLDQALDQAEECSENVRIYAKGMHDILDKAIRLELRPLIENKSNGDVINKTG